MKCFVVFLYRMRGYLMAAAVLVGLGVATTVLVDSAAPIAAVLTFVALSLLIIAVLLSLIGGRCIPRQQPVVVAAPVKGRWLALNSPASKVPSHGVYMYGQTYAIDLVSEPNVGSRPAFGSGSAMRGPGEYPAMGEPVYAMIDGTVVRATGWHRDHTARSNWVGLLYMFVEGMVRELGGPAFILGNHVIIRGEGGLYSLVAHLQRDSLTVRPGDTVGSGQQIGRCGNSGNSSEPHVHAQLMDRRSCMCALGVPISFQTIRIDDKAPVQNGLPKSGERMSS